MLTNLTLPCTWQKTHSWGPLLRETKPVCLCWGNGRSEWATNSPFAYFPQSQATAEKWRQFNARSCSLQTSRTQNAGSPSWHPWALLSIAFTSCTTCKHRWGLFIFSICPPVKPSFSQFWAKAGTTSKIKTSAWHAVLGSSQHWCDRLWWCKTGWQTGAGLIQGHMPLLQQSPCHGGSKTQVVPNSCLCSHLQSLRVHKSLEWEMKAQLHLPVFFLYLLSVCRNRSTRRRFQDCRWFAWIMPWFMRGADSGLLFLAVINTRITSASSHIWRPAAEKTRLTMSLRAVSKDSTFFTYFLLFFFSFEKKKKRG